MASWKFLIQKSFRSGSCPPFLRPSKLREWTPEKARAFNGRWQHWPQIPRIEIIFVGISGIKGRNSCSRLKIGWHLGDNLLVRFTQGMDGLLGVAGMIITSDYGSFPHSLLSTSKITIGKKNYIGQPQRSWWCKNMGDRWDTICRLRIQHDTTNRKGTQLDLTW